MIQLERLMPALFGKPRVELIFFVPYEKTLNWARGPLWERAAKIPGVEVKIDLGGAEARNFDSKTSGQTILYDQKGKLLFSGGLTPERGHEGASLGQDQLIRLLTKVDPEFSEASVFGCSLFNPERPIKSVYNEE